MSLSVSLSLSVCLSLFHVSLSFFSRVSHSLSTLSVCLSVCLSVSIIWHRKSWVTIGNSLIISRSQTLQDTLCCFQMNYTLVLYKLTQLRVSKSQICTTGSITCGQSFFDSRLLESKGVETGLQFYMPKALSTCSAYPDYTSLAVLALRSRINSHPK